MLDRGHRLCGYLHTCHTERTLTKGLPMKRLVKDYRTTLLTL